MTDHKVVSRPEWQAVRDELLQREKEQTRMADELARQRRELPWVAVEKGSPVAAPHKEGVSWPVLLRWRGIVCPPCSCMAR